MTSYLIKKHPREFLSGDIVLGYTFNNIVIASNDYYNVYDKRNATVTNPWYKCTRTIVGQVPKNKSSNSWDVENYIIYTTDHDYHSFFYIYDKGRPIFDVIRNY